MKQIFSTFLLLGVVIYAQAGPPAASVGDARVRLLPGDLPLAGYFVITSDAPKPLRLVGATSPDFGGVMLHQSVEEGGVARMAHVEGVTIGPGQSVEFSPGGYHLMLMGSKQTLHVGDEVPITLRFSGGQELAVRFKVVGARGE